MSAREVQKSLNMSSPSLATFHLEKLEKAGLVTRTPEGSYFADKAYLRHFIRVRRILIPRFVFHSALATFFVLGWLVLFLSFFYFPGSLLYAQNSGPNLDLAVAVSYGLVITTILATLFWFETLRVVRKEKI